MNKQKPRVCLACQNCRRRKVKCTGGEVCNECRRFNVKCVYREHYREKKNFSIKILQTPDFAAAKNRPPAVRSEPVLPINGLVHNGHPDHSLLPHDQQQFHTYHHDYTNHHDYTHHHYSKTPSNDMPHAIVHTDVKYQLPSPPPPAQPSTLQPQSPNNVPATIPIESSKPAREPLGPSAFLKKVNKFMESMHPMAALGEYHIGTEAGTLLHQLVNLPKQETTTAKSHILLHDKHLTEEQMLSCLGDYFNSYHVMLPFLDPSTWMRKAKSIWRAMEYGTHSLNTTIDKLELASLYMVVALGCSGSFSLSFAGIEDQEWAEEYSRRAKALIPSILLPPSVALVHYILLRSVYEVSQGDAEVGYLYSGTMVRIVMALDMHRTIDPSKIQTLDAFERHRAWICAYMWEKYWCFCVGKPSCIGAEMPMPVPYGPAFVNDTIYSMDVEHVMVRIRYVLLCDTVKRWNNDAAKKDVISVFNHANEAAKQVGQIMEESSADHLKHDNLDLLAGYTVEQIKEWYWLRLYYWFNRLILYRPFLLLFAYLDIPGTHDFGDISEDIVNALKQGTEHCLEAALQLPRIVMKLDERLARCQIKWFTSSYLEVSCSVLLLYAVCQQRSPHTVDKCMQAFNQSCDYMNSVLSGGGVGILSKERIGVIQRLVADQSIRQALSRVRCNFAKVFFAARMPELSPQEQYGNIMGSIDAPEKPQQQQQQQQQQKRPREVDANVPGGYQPSGELDQSMIEQYWQLTLDLVGFSG